MKSYIPTFVLALAIIALGMPAFADVKLSVDENIKVIAINGTEVKHGLLQPLKREFVLPSGQNTITARYDRMFDLPRGEHDYVKSANLSLTIQLTDNQSYQLIMPNQPANYLTAKDYAKAPRLAITQNGQILHQTTTDSTPAPAQNTPHQSTNPKAVSPANKNNLDGFMKIWLNSSEEEREKIRQWVQK